MSRRANLFLLNDLLPAANHVDVKSLRTEASLREVIAGFLSYNPRWVDFLVRLRGAVAKVLGLKHADEPVQQIQPEAVPFEAGKSLRFFVVSQAKEGEYWIAEMMEDKHLRAWIAVLAEPSAPADPSGRHGVGEFHVVTVVRYKHWTGLLYFNLIRPFHHAIVWAAVRSVERALAARS